MMWWGNFLHEMGDPSTFSKSLVGLFGALAIWVWRLGKKIKTVYMWTDAQMPKTEKEKEKIETRERFITDLMSKELVTKEDCAIQYKFSQMNIERMKERFDEIKSDIREVKDEISKLTHEMIKKSIS